MTWIFRNGKPLFTASGKPAFSDGDACKCCNPDEFGPPVICCDPPRTVHSINITIGGLIDIGPCPFCRWAFGATCAYDFSNEWLEMPLSNMNGSFALSRDGLEGVGIPGYGFPYAYMGQFGYRLGVFGDPDNPGRLVQHSYNTNYGPSRYLYCWMIRSQYLCENYIAISYYFQGCTFNDPPSCGWFFLGCSFGALTCGDFAPLNVPYLPYYADGADLCADEVAHGSIIIDETASATCPYYYEGTLDASIS